MTATERLIARLDDELRELREENGALRGALEGVMRHENNSNATAVEAMRRLAASWERQGHHEAAKDARDRADKLAKKLQEAA